MKKRIISVMLAVLTVNFGCTGVNAADKLPAFPGAEGGGMYTKGARAAENFEIYHVTNLNDSGEGSFRDALSKGNRIIVFDISGTIMLKSLLCTKNIDNMTILGQTAPGDGICIGGESTLFENCNNLIIRYMRFRPGDVGLSEEDGLGLRQCTDVIIDHCSVSWSVDECLSAYANRNFTALYNIISNSLNTSVHSKGMHGYGGIWGGENASFHHNLISSHYSRMPRIGTSATVHSYKDHPDSESLTDIRNNVFYNWGNRAGYGGENKVRVNFVNNYYKKGPASEKNYIYERSDSVVYASGNIMEGIDAFNADNSKGISGSVLLDEIGTNGEFLADYPVNTETAEAAYKNVLENVGASYVRDDIDKMIINDVINGTAHSGSKGSKYLIDSQTDMGGWIYLDTAKIQDSDGDGIPDDWESQNGLDKNDPADAAKISSSGYTNIENYANDTVKTVKHNNTDTTALRQAIFNVLSFNREYYYPDGMDVLDARAEDGKAALSSTQSRIDSAREDIDAAFAALLPRYKIRLKDLIEKVEKTDITGYLPQSAHALEAAVEKAKNDLNGVEDNELFRYDYDMVTKAYGELEYSEKWDIFTNRLEQSKNMCNTENVYTKDSIERMTAAIAEVEKAVDEGGLTDEKIDDLIQILSRAYMEKLRYSAIEHDIELIDGGILGKDFIDAKAAANLEKLRAECEELLKKSFEDNTQIDTLNNKVLNAIKEIKHNKNHIYLQDFEGEKPQPAMGSYTVEKDGGNSYAHITEPLTLVTDTNADMTGEGVYYSIDYTDIGEYNYENAVIGLVFGDKYAAKATAFPKSTTLMVTICDTPYIFYEDTADFSLIKYTDGWDNMTMHFSPSSNKLTVYRNNSRIFDVDMPEDCGGVTEFGIIDRSYKSKGLDNNVNALNADNIAVFKLDGNTFLYGDADCDGSITASDAAFVLQKTLKEESILPIQNKTDDWFKYIDVDKDGYITASDAAEIIQKTLKESYFMPAENQ